MVTRTCASCGHTWNVAEHLMMLVRFKDVRGWNASICAECLSGYLKDTLMARNGYEVSASRNVVITGPIR